MKLFPKYRSINSLILLAFSWIFTGLSAQNKPPQMPENISFAGEVVPLHIPDVYERLERELVINTYRHGATIMILKKSGRWQEYITKLLKEQDIHPDFYYLSVIESDLDPNARSPSGAVGFWQFLESTAREYGLDVTNHIDQRRDPELSTLAATRYLKKAFEQYGSWALAAAAYNRGQAGIGDALKSQKVNSYYDLYLNEETYRYIFRILALKLIIENPVDYGFELEDEDYYQSYTYNEIEINSSIEDLPSYAQSLGITYKELKEHNPWIFNRDYRLIVPAGKTYKIKIPVEPTAR